MGEQPAPIAVADAGPLIHLGEIERLPLLAVFSAVHIPDAVWGECVGRGRVSEAILAGAASIQRHRVPDEVVNEPTLSEVAAGLHRGEIECLALCGMLHIPLLLTDDLAARDAAKSSGIQPVGSVSVILRAYRSGLLSRAETEELLERLYARSSLFATRAIIDYAREALDRNMT